MMRLTDFTFKKSAALAINLGLALVLYTLCRVTYYLVNSAAFPDMDGHHLATLMLGGFRFDLTTLIYLNGLYILMVLLPLHFKENRRGYERLSKVVYMLFNGAALVMNLMDSVYFQYTNRRSTATLFREFAHEKNIGSVVGIEFLNHWYLVLWAIILLWGLWRLYRPTSVKVSSLRGYYTTQLLSLFIAVPLCIGGARGGFAHSTRPITISNANEYARSPIETAIVLNTPFSMIRTMGKKAFVTPHFFTDRQEMEALYSPLHLPIDSLTFTPRNVVVFIVESMSQEYLDKGFTPFINSLAAKGTTFDMAIANGRKSIDAMPSVLSSIPMFVEPFFLTPASLNTLSGMAGELKKKGYTTAFYHGAPNGSMGFQAFANASGFDSYYGMDEYLADPSFGGKADFDGMWAIWDEEFLQFFVKSLGGLKEPFATSLFTATSHHPFAIPEKYKERFAQQPDDFHPICHCVRYTDYALKRFFEEAEKQPWFENTLFVLTADHTSHNNGGVYGTDIGRYRVPVIFYAPDGSLAAHRQAIAQQIDIFPTLMGMLHYDKPYIAFGQDLTQTTDEESFAVNYVNGNYQLLSKGYLLQFDGQKSCALYHYATDSLLQENLLPQLNKCSNTIYLHMENKLKSIIQHYMERMNNDQLTIIEP